MESIVLRYDKGESIGSINSVDTGMATAIIDSDDVLSQLQINQLIAIQSPKSGRYIIAMIVKIYRKATDMTLNDDEDEEDTSSAFNQVRLVFVGEFMDKAGEQSNVFRRNVSAVPSISAFIMLKGATASATNENTSLIDAFTFVPIAISTSIGMP